jgi:hypothetical protein
VYASEDRLPQFIICFLWIPFRLLQELQLLSTRRTPSAKRRSSRGLARYLTRGRVRFDCCRKGSCICSEGRARILHLRGLMQFAFVYQFEVKDISQIEVRINGVECRPGGEEG